MFALLALGGYWAAGGLGADRGPFLASGMDGLVRGIGSEIWVLGAAAGPSSNGKN